MAEKPPLLVIEDVPIPPPGYSPTLPPTVHRKNRRRGRAKKYRHVGNFTAPKGIHRMAEMQPEYDSSNDQKNYLTLSPSAAEVNPSDVMAIDADAGNTLPDAFLKPLEEHPEELPVEFAAVTTPADPKFLQRPLSQSQEDQICWRLPVCPRKVNNAKKFFRGHWHEPSAVDYHQACVYIRRDWGCDAAEAVPLQLRKCTPYSLALLLWSFVSRARTGTLLTKDQHVLAESLLMEARNERLESTKGVAETQSHMTITRNPLDNSELGILGQTEVEVEENYLGLMLADVLVAIGKVEVPEGLAKAELAAQLEKVKQRLNSARLWVGQHGMTQGYVPQARPQWLLLADRPRGAEQGSGIAARVKLSQRRRLHSEPQSGSQAMQAIEEIEPNNRSSTLGKKLGEKFASFDMDNDTELAGNRQRFFERGGLSRQTRKKWRSTTLPSERVNLKAMSLQATEADPTFPEQLALLGQRQLPG